MSLPMPQYASSSTILLISSPLLLLLIQLCTFSAEASFITIYPHLSHSLRPATDFIIPPESKRYQVPPTPHANSPSATPIASAPHNSNPLIPAPNSNVPPKPKQHHRLTSTPLVKTPAPAPATITAFSPHNSHPLIPAPDFSIAPGPQSTPHAKAPAAPFNSFSPHSSHPFFPAPDSLVPSVAPVNSPHAHNQPSHHHHHHHHHHHQLQRPGPHAFSPHSSHPLIPAPESIVPSVAPVNSPHAHNQPSHHHHHHYHHQHHHHHHLPPKNVVANSPSPTPSLHFNKGPAASPIAFSPHNSHPLIQAPESIVPSEAPAHPLPAHNTHSHHHHHLPPKNVVANSPSPTPSLHFNPASSPTHRDFKP